MNREKFPMLNDVVYLDSAAGTLKPIEVVSAMNDFYLSYPINTHSQDSRLGVKVAKLVDESRDLVAKLVNSSKEEVIFTSGTTDSLNKIAVMLKPLIKSGDEILLSYFNHSSNVLPWMEIAKQVGAKIVYSNNLVKDINSKTKIVAYAQVNNTIDEKLVPIEIFNAAKKFNTIVVNDAAQAIVHDKVSLHESDVLVFSGNKLYGPTGIGTLVVKSELLSKLEPATFGGGAVAEIKKDSWVKKDSYFKYEPGTLNTAGIIGLGASIKYFNNLKNFKEHEFEVANYAFEKLSKIKDIVIYSQKGDLITLFNIGSYSPQDIVSYLGHRDILLRAGEHCARVASDILEYKASVRVSIAHYNTKEDIDKLITTLENGGDFLDFI